MYCEFLCVALMCCFMPYVTLLSSSVLSFLKSFFIEILCTQNIKKFQIWVIGKTMITFSFHAFSFLRSEILTTRPSALRCLYVCLSYVPNSVYQKEASFLLKKNIAQCSRRSRSDKVLVQWTASSGDWVKSTL